MKPKFHSIMGAPGAICIHQNLLKHLICDNELTSVNGIFFKTILHQLAKSNCELMEHEKSFYMTDYTMLKVTLSVD